MNVQTNNKLNSTKGFTIIEVVLVLAIAALIFLMIFVALPALQRGQRDTARKNEAGIIATAVNTYRSNRNNTLPPAGAFPSGYLDSLNQIPSSSVTVRAGATNYAAPGEDTAQVYRNSECSSGATPVAATTSNKKAAVVVYVENGGYYCQNV